MIKRFCWSCFFIAYLLYNSSSALVGQVADLAVPRNADQIEFPFRYENNFIVVDLLFNGFLPLHFIFDTGASHTILTKREISDLLQIDYKRRFNVMGADMETELTAYLAQGISMRIKGFRAINRSILVLDDDYFRFEEFVGVNIHGILGADIFRRFVVKIDYRRKRITLYKPRYFEPPEDFVELPVTITKTKPYLLANTIFGDSITADVKLLMDTGANLPFLLHTNTHPNLKLPENVIRSQFGAGLGGELEGFVGRIQRLDIEGMSFNNLITTFQEVSPDMDSTFLNQRNGLIGNPVLSRFTIIMDYVREKCYVKPNKKFKQSFKYDRSGLLLAASGPRLDEYIIYGIVPNSPADEAGLQIGDKLLKVNWWPAGFYSLQGITNKLQGRIGKKIKMKVKRNGETLKFRFRLRDLI
ncbi:MAG: aspartyl protease family protein [Bacteroidota bacterium]